MLTSISVGTALKYLHTLSAASPPVTVRVGSCLSDCVELTLMLLLPLLPLLPLLLLLPLLSLLSLALSIVLVFPTETLVSETLEDPPVPDICFVAIADEEEEEEEEAVCGVLIVSGCLASTLCTIEKQHTIACSLCSITLRASMSAAE